MHVLVIRHAIAEDRDTWAQSGEPDDRRPLTDRGRRRMKRGARGLHRLVPRLDVLAASPYARAAETATIVASAYGRRLVPTSLASLVPDAPLDATGEWLATHGDDATVAIVGHEPHLSRLVGWLLTGADRPPLTLKKGGACLLDFDGGAKPGEARLCWLLEAGQLRRLG